MNLKLGRNIHIWRFSTLLIMSVLILKIIYTRFPKRKAHTDFFAKIIALGPVIFNAFEVLKLFFKEIL